MNLYIWTPEYIEAAREWLKDCSWADMEDEDFDDLPDEKIKAGINNYYAGGIPEFLRTCNYSDIS